MQISAFSNRQNTTTKARHEFLFSPFVSHLLGVFYIFHLHVNNFCLLSTRLNNITLALQLIDQILPYSEDHSAGGTYIQATKGSIERAIIILDHMEIVSLAGKKQAR